MLTVLDLLSPLAPGHGTDAPARGIPGRMLALLEVLRRQRVPWVDHLVPPSVAASLAHRGADSTLHQRLYAVARDAARVGLAPPQVEVVLFASPSPGDVVDALPHPTHPQIVLYLDQLEDLTRVDAALARGLALLARWHHQRLPTPVPWDRIAVLGQVPLAEWVYAEGLAHHFLATLHPDLPPHRRFGIPSAAFRRLRERESSLRVAIDADLPRTGIGPWGRWFDTTVRAGSGHGASPTGIEATAYLAWRMTGDRVARLGLERAAQESV